MKDNLRVLLLGDASNYHNSLAQGLRRRGHTVVVASHGSRRLDTLRDIDISRRHRGKPYGFELWLRMMLMLRDKLAGYDVVQVVPSSFADLRPQRLGSIFERLCRANRHIYMTSLGTDTVFVESCLDPDTPLRYTEWAVDGQPTQYHLDNRHLIDGWRSRPVADLCTRMYTRAEGIATALYEYDLATSRAGYASKTLYTGIPIDVASLPYIPAVLDQSRPLRILVAMIPHRMAEKGTDRLLAAARKVEHRHPDAVKVDVVGNLPYNAFVDRLCDADIILDQLYSYSPATTAMLAMAMGKITVSGGEPEFYDFIGEHRLQPIINALPDDEVLVNTIEHIVTHRSDYLSHPAMGREFVRKHNDVDVVAARFESLWQQHSNL